MRRNKNIILPSIAFFDAGAKGVAVGKAEDGRMVFVKNAVPGDIAHVKVTQRKKNYYEGKAIDFQQYSEYRVQPKCEHFGVCGGCKWQNLSYERQLFYKAKEVEINFKKIAHLTPEKIEPILGAEHSYFYRNKLEFSFSDKRWITEEEVQNNTEIIDSNALGFHLPGMWSKILNLNHCYLQEAPSDAIRLFVKKKCEALNIPFFNVKEQKGVMRTLMLRNNSLGEFMLVFQLFENHPKMEELFQSISDEFKEVISINYVINPKSNDSIYDLSVQNYVGKGYIIEQLENLQFKISPKSFFQTHTLQALKLYQLTRKYADLQGDEIVYDLYTGTGTIAQFVASNAKKVIGIESVPEAIEAAKENARINGIDNCEFYCGDMKDIFTPEFVSNFGKPQVLITDPPREGMHSKVVENILYLQPQKIVYVSCNSATQARDIDLLKDKYYLKLIHPVDMFPQTHHVENIAVLELK